MAPPKRTGLGRGIGALIPTSDGEHPVDDVFFAHEPGLLAVPGARLAEIALDRHRAQRTAAARRLP